VTLTEINQLTPKIMQIPKTQTIKQNA